MAFLNAISFKRHQKIIKGLIYIILQEYNLPTFSGMTEIADRGHLL